MSPQWKIGRKGRAWDADDAFPRYELAPEKIEMCDGTLFWSDRERLTMLALLLENLGVDAAVTLGDLAVWQEAVKARENALGGSDPERSS